MLVFGLLSNQLGTPKPPRGITDAPLHGERYSEPVIDYLHKITAAGALVEGVVGQSLSKVRVLDR
jgi:arginine/lysine/ornithine decarboxylase